MSLNWNIEKVANFKDKCRQLNGELEYKTNKLIWMTMTVGMPEITLKNYAEFFRRVRFAQLLCGDTNLISFFEVRDHIGLSTNASSLTWSQFVKRITTNWQA